jgi:phasin family protein
MAKSTSLTPAAAEALEKMISGAEDQMEKAVVNTSRLVEQATEFTRGNVQALFASTRIATAGLEALGQEATTLVPKIEDLSAVWAKLGKSKSPDELLKLQSTLFSSTIEKFMSDSAHMAEAMMKLGFDVADPLTRRCEAAFADMSSTLIES